MSDQTKVLPALTVPESGYDLIDAYAHDQRISKSEALRRIIAESPSLNAYAKKHGYTVNFQVKQWGGQRRGED